MLTAEIEGGQIKAHNYWSQKHFGPLHLQFLSEHRASLEPAKINRHRARPVSERRRSGNPSSSYSSMSKAEIPELERSSEQPYVIVRRFTLSNGNEPFARMREIIHLQYSNWPDFGAPAHPAHLLGLVEQTNAVIRGSHASSPSGLAEEDSKPLLVHCSAGCGRTGTFCAVDSVMDIMKRQRATRPQSTKMQKTSPTDVIMTSPQNPFNSAFATMSNPMHSTESGLEEDSWLHNDEIDLIDKVVKDFRLQRLSMVQSLRQFVLCYESVLEWLAEQTPRSA
jgi:protein tyrosine phosphatase